MKSLKQNNRGLTLIELLLGVVILALIITPLLRAFVTGAGTENKARKYGNATAAAQNLSEQIQAFDIDDILTSSAIVSSDAYYCNEAGERIGTAAKPDEPVNYMRIEDYKFGSSTFDALIRFEATPKSEVSVSNRLDAYLDMTAADEEAAGALLSACDGLELVDAAPPSLNRLIDLTITKASENSFTVRATFNYSAVIIHTRLDADGKTVEESTAFSYSVSSSVLQSSVRPSTDNRPAFSIYLFFDAYYKNNVSEIININNNTGTDNTTGTEINAFIVNTNKTGKIYAATINYKTQMFKQDNTPVNSLVYTNLPEGSVKYYAWKDAVQRTTVTTVGGLVEKAIVDRKYNIKVQLFEPEANFSGTPTAGFDSVKLS